MTSKSAKEVELLKARLAGCTVRAIQRGTAKHYHLKVGDLLVRRRPASLVRARQMAMYLTRTLTAHSLPELGRHFSRRHTTVMHGVRKITTAITTQRETPHQRRGAAVEGAAPKRVMTPKPCIR